MVLRRSQMSQKTTARYFKPILGAYITGARPSVVLHNPFGVR
jgi:hypothetical protein